MQPSPRPGFSLQLERGAGRLVLGARPVGPLMVESMSLSLESVPSRIDMRVGADGFRHQRTRLDRLSVYLDEDAVTRLLAAATVGGPLEDLEVRATEGDLVIAGVLRGAAAAPFCCRIRLAPAGVADERTLLVSAYETRVFGPSSVPAPLLARRLLVGLGLEPWLQGPTVAAVDPVEALVLEICAALGWKAPDREATRVEAVRCEAGRIQLVAARPTPRPALGPRRVVTAGETTWRARRFFEDYEAKALFAAIEGHLADGQHQRAARGYERQLEVHPAHPFLVERILQLQVADETAADQAQALAQARLTRFPEDAAATLALATIHLKRGRPVEAATLFERLARQAATRGDPVEAAQAEWAAAQAREAGDPVGAIAAYEVVLRTRPRLTGVLRALGALYQRTGDHAAALRVQRRLVAAATGPEAARRERLRLGEMALEAGGDSTVARQAFADVLREAPHDVSALEGLARAAEAEGDPLGAVRALDRAARALQERADASGAAALVTRIGQLWSGMESGADTAALRFRQALLLDPHHAPALFGLADLAAAADDHAEARRRLEEILRLDQASPHTAGDRAAVHLRLGGLLRTEDPALAVVHLQKALDGEPAVVEAALEALESVHAAAGRFDDLARTLEMAAARAEAPAVRGRRLARLAGIWADRLGDAERAAGLLHEAARLCPEDASPLARLAALYRDDARYGPLAEVLGELARRVDEPERLADLYVERAELLRSHLNRTEEAAEAYGLALGCRPADQQALSGLADIYRGHDRAPELAEVLARLARLESGRDAGLLWLELGRLQVEVLRRPAAAQQSLEAALQVLPDDTEVLRRLGDLHFEASEYEAALARYARLADLYDEEGFDERAPPFLRRLADVQAECGLGETARETLARAAREGPDEVATYEQAQDLLLRAGDVPGIAAFFVEGLERAQRPATRLFLTRRAGRLLWRELRRPSQAGPLLDEALALDPGDADVIRVRLEVATAQGDWQAVARLLRAQIAVAPSTRRPALLTRLARLAASQLDRPAEAMRLAQAALAERGDFAPAHALLADVAFAEGAWAVARGSWEALEGAGEALDPEARRRLAVATARGGDAATAAGRFEALYAETADPHALRGWTEALFALGDLEALAPLMPQRLAECEDPGERSALEARFLALRGPLEEVEAVAASVEAEAPAVEKIEVAAAEAEPLGPALVSAEPAEAAPAAPPVEEAALVEAAQAEPAPVEPAPGEEAPATELEGVASGPPPLVSSPPADEPAEAEAEEGTEAGPPPSVLPPSISAEASVDSLAEPAPDAAPADRPGGGGQRAAVNADDPMAGLAAHRRAVDEAADDVARAAALLELAEYQRDVLYAPDDAVPHFAAALDVGQPGGPTWSEALEALEDLLALRGDWAGLLALYDRREAAGVTPLVELALLRAAALRADGRSEAALAAAVEARPDRRAVALEADLLVELGRAAEAAERLVTDLRVEQGAEAAERLSRAAELLSEAEPERAAALAGRAYAADPDAELLDRWLAAARRAQSPVALGAALEARATTLSGPRRSRALLEAAGALSEARPAEARRLLEASLQAWPDNLDALFALDRALVALDDVPALVVVLERQLAMAVAGPWRGEVALRLARLHVERLDAPSEALPLLDLAVEDLEDPGAAEALRAEVVRSQSEAPAAALEPASAPAAALEPPSAPAAALEPPSAPAGASAPPAPARLVRVTGPPADPQLAALWREGDLEGLAESLAARARWADGGERAALLARRGVLLARHLDDAAGAFEAFDAALDEPDAPLEVVMIAAQGLAATVTGAMEIRLLVARVNGRLQEATDRQARASLLALRGSLRHGWLEDADGARADFQAAAAELPGAALAAAGLAAIAMDGKAWRPALAWLQTALHAGPDNAAPLSPEQEAVAFRRLTQALGALGRRSELPGFARGVLDANPGCLPALSALDASLAAEGAWADLLGRIDAAIAVLPGVPVPLGWRRAEVLAGPLRRRDEAAVAVKRVLERAPQHREARRLALALAGEREAWADYVMHGEALLRLPAEPEGRNDPDVLRLAVARVYADLLAQPVQALVHLRALDAEGALPAEAIDLYVHAASAAGDPDVISAALQARVRLDASVDARLALAEHHAAWGERAAAVAALSDLDADSLDAEGRARLAALRVSLGG